ncbi:hypothetical protein QE152_g37030 [Popillia japonica]|uniref:Uncharacterized protein n=1 Tax=Popillia japonica TaxID=7064 RepID=A0AAW1IBH1_POPJA
MNLQRQADTFAIAVLLMEEEEEEESLLLWAYKKPNKKVSEIFMTRETERVFNLTVERRLFGNEQKFREYFRFSMELFQIVLQYIKEVTKLPYNRQYFRFSMELFQIVLQYIKEVTKLPYNRHKNPISAKEKLSITLHCNSEF